MGMATQASVEINAGREEVFRWLVEPEKLTAWMGGAGAMPADTTQLKAGFTAAGTMAAPGGERPTTLTITAWDPPNGFTCTVTYPGGDSTSVYTLTEVGAVTTLQLASDTDWASTDESALDKAMAGQSDAVKNLVEEQLHKLEDQLAHGAFDSGTQVLMQKSVEGSLAKLKGLIEAG